MTVTAGAWQPAPPVKGSDRQMASASCAIENAKPGELYEVTIPERGRAALLAHAARPSSPTPA